MLRPDLAEVPPFFHGYLALAPGGDLAAQLRTLGDETHALLRSLEESQAAHRYAADKWSVRQVVGHLADSERILGCRALCIARGETQALPGFDEDAYVRHGGFDRRSMAALADELRSVRHATLSLLGGIDAEAAARCGIANGKPITVRALGWVLLGHERHHRQVLRERYSIG